MQITWDRWAVPTITGDDDLDVVRGIGYAQAVAVVPFTLGYHWEPALAREMCAMRAVIPGAGHGVQRTGQPFNERVELLWRQAAGDR